MASIEFVHFDGTNTSLNTYSRQVTYPILTLSYVTHRRQLQQAQHMIFVQVLEIFPSHNI